MCYRQLPLLTLALLARRVDAALPLERFQGRGDLLGQCGQRIAHGVERLLLYDNCTLCGVGGTLAGAAVGRLALGALALVPVEAPRRRGEVVETLDVRLVPSYL